MPAVQTTYDASFANGRPGMIANGETNNIITRAVEDAAGIAFGRFAFRGTSDNGCTATPTAGTLLGLVVANKAQTPVPGGPNADIVAQREQAGIMTLGAAFVIVGEDVTDGAQVYVTSAGVIVDTVGSNIIAPGWFFDETVANGGICRIVRR